jgi:hypothetical protein
LVVGIAVSISCSLALATDKTQCSSDQDCAARGPDFVDTKCLGGVCDVPPDTSWACVGRVAGPVEGATYQASVRVIDLIANKPPAGATIKLCNKFDPPCEGPLLDVPIPADGLVTAAVASTFSGFFFVKTPTSLPTLYFVDTGAPSTGTPPTMALLTPAASDALNVAFKTKPRPNSGSVSITVTDCNGKKAAGVHFDVDATDVALPYYVLASAIAPNATATDPGGSAGFANLDEGSLTIRATVEKTGLAIGSITTLIRPGAITFQAMRPTPTISR